MPFQTIYPDLDQQMGQPEQPGQYIQGSPGIPPCQGDNCQMIQPNMMIPRQQICEGESCQMMPKCVGENCQSGQMPFQTIYPDLDQQTMPLPEGQTPLPTSSLFSKFFGILVNNTKSLLELFIEVF